MFCLLIGRLMRKEMKETRFLFGIAGSLKFLDTRFFVPPAEHSLTQIYADFFDRI
jgi:hypothetical protein